MDDQTPFRRLADIYTRLVELLPWMRGYGDGELSTKLTGIAVDFALILGGWIGKHGDWPKHDIFRQFVGINEEFIRLGNWLNHRNYLSLAFKFVPITDDLDRLVAELSVKRR